ncbi:MAG: hypothetical protein HYY44_03775 [Deltaproteobacteria bacterium]|nr:hypothetical protein [Deltaproteobacteria bacterium]
MVPWDAVRSPITTRLFEGLNLDGDSHSDFLFLVSLELYVEPQARERQKTTCFLVRISGNEDSDKTGSPSVEMIKKGALLAVASHPGSSHPITDLKIARRPDGRSEVSYKLFDAAKKEFVPRNVDNGPVARNREEQYQNDRHLFDTLFDVQSYLLNSLGYFFILQGAEFSKGTAANEQASKSVTMMYNSLSAPWNHLITRYESIARDPEQVAYYQERDADFIPFMKAMAIAGRKQLFFRREDSDKTAELATRSERLMTESLASYRWKGKGLTRAEFYQTLRETEEPVERRQLLEGYSEAALKAHREGLFPMVGELNGIARRYGFANYAELVGRLFNGITPMEFDKLVRGFYDANEARIKAFVAELRELNGGKPVNEWDAHYLGDKLARKKLGNSPLPKLKFKDALDVSKRFFKEIGIDLDGPPFAGNIFYDTNKREDKYGNAFAQTLGDGRQAWFNTNFDPAEEISLEDLGTVIHELTHDIHMIQAAQRARGNVAMGIDGNPNTWTESIAFAVDSLVGTKKWMDRYLSHLPQFRDPEIRKAIAEANEGLALYDQMIVLLRARFEINLYEDRDSSGRERPLEERLNFYPELVRRFLHVEAMDGTKGGRIWATPHFAGLPGYYVSYQGGFPTALKATQPIYEGVGKGDSNLLHEGGRRLLRLFGLGARVTSIQEIDAAIEK